MLKVVRQWIADRHPRRSENAEAVRGMIPGRFDATADEIMN